MTAAGVSLLPPERPFRRLFLPFALPYFAYVALGLIPDVIVRSLARLLVVGSLLVFFRKEYRFGPPLKPIDCAWMLAGAAAAVALWIASLRLCYALPWWRPAFEAARSAEYSPLYVLLRGFNSALLVPVFEELLCRAFIPEIFLAGQAARWDRTWLDRRPAPLDRPPVWGLPLAAAAAFFALGHDNVAMAPALLYFLFTGWIYARTRSFRVVVGIHGLTNLALTVLAASNPDFHYLWW